MGVEDTNNSEEQPSYVDELAVPSEIEIMYKGFESFMDRARANPPTDLELVDTLEIMGKELHTFAINLKSFYQRLEETKRGGSNYLNRAEWARGLAEDNDFPIYLVDEALEVGREARFYNLLGGISLGADVLLQTERSEQEARELSVTYGFPARELVDALVAGRVSAFGNYLDRIQKGNLQHEDRVRELSTNMGLPSSKIEAALVYGRKAAFDRHTKIAELGNQLSSKELDEAIGLVRQYNFEASPKLGTQIKLHERFRARVESTLNRKELENMAIHALVPTPENGLNGLSAGERKAIDFALSIGRVPQSLVNAAIANNS